MSPLPGYEWTFEDGVPGTFPGRVVDVRVVLLDPVHEPDTRFVRGPIVR